MANFDFDSRRIPHACLISAADMAAAMAEAKRLAAAAVCEGKAKRPAEVAVTAARQRPASIPTSA